MYFHQTVERDTSHHDNSLELETDGRGGRRGGGVCTVQPGVQSESDGRHCTVGLVYSMLVLLQLSLLIGSSQSPVTPAPQ